MIHSLPLAFLDFTTIPWIRPLWVVGLGVIAAVLILFAVYSLLKLIAPKLAAVTYATGREALSQPLFYVLLFLGMFALVISPFLSYFTLGDDIKMIESQGLPMIMVVAIILALWTASVSIAEEIEGRTAMTVLSKPIGRWHYVLGKFLGILWPVVLLFVLLGAVFLATVSYKVQYDARESCKPVPTWQECDEEMERVLPGLGLGLLEVVVLTSISVAISTRLPMLPNLVICGSIYALGHLVPALVNSTIGQLEYVAFIGRGLAMVLPILGHFDISPAIFQGSVVPWSYVGWAALYSVAYSAVAMLMALLLFENRDLA